MHLTRHFIAAAAQNLHTNVPAGPAVTPPGVFSSVAMPKLASTRANAAADGQECARRAKCLLEAPATVDAQVCGTNLSQLGLNFGRSCAHPDERAHRLCVRARAPPPAAQGICTPL